MPTLQLYFLGTLDIRYDDRQLPKPATLKSQSLLAYLPLHRDRPQPRDRLADLFWGGRPERKARRSLTTALWHIRRCLPDEELILSDPHTVQFDPHADLWLDVDEFESRVSHDDLASLQAAVALYRGDFLDGFYGDWIINERYRLETLFSEALARLMVTQEANGEHEAALATALRLLDHDALREDAHRLAMHAYCHLGQRYAALEQYRRCREIVLEELSAEPMVETSELYQAILEGRVAVGRARPVQIPAAAPSVPAGRSPLDVIAPSRLVGREEELAFLHECWQGAEAGQGGLALISGEAGVGKTRLVEEFANRLRWRGVPRAVGPLLRIRASPALPAPRRGAADRSADPDTRRTGGLSRLDPRRGSPPGAGDSGTLPRFGGSSFGTFRIWPRIGTYWRKGASTSFTCATMHAGVMAPRLQPGTWSTPGDAPWIRPSDHPMPACCTT